MVKMMEISKMMEVGENDGMIERSEKRNDRRKRSEKKLFVLNSYFYM